MDNNKYTTLSLISVMAAFLAMGFYDVIGVASNYLKLDFQLSDTVVGSLSTLLFLSFLLFSIPTSVLMTKIGQKRTVMLSIILMGLALSFLLLSYTFESVIAFYALLGVGITLIQVAASPLLANIVSGKRLSSALTLGQFVKALGSFTVPFLAAWASLKWGSWTNMLPLIMGYGALALVVLWFTPIHEQPVAKNMGMRFTLGLLNNRIIRISFIAMLCHVGIDVGMNISAPQLLMERTGCALDTATYANSVYFLLRTIGCLIGAVTLSKVSPKLFFNIGSVLMAIGFVGLFFAPTVGWLYFFVGLVGIGNSNVFSIIVARCLLLMPKAKNEVSALMIMGLVGGAIFPLLMGIASDYISSQIGGVIVLLGALLYMATWALRTK